MILGYRAMFDLGGEVIGNEGERRGVTVGKKIELL